MSQDYPQNPSLLGAETKTLEIATLTELRNKLLLSGNFQQLLTGKTFPHLQQEVVCQNQEAGMFVINLVYQRTDDYFII